MPAKVAPSKPARASAIDPDKLYTYAEIAALASVNPRRVRQWVEDGKLSYTPLPGGRGRRVAGGQWLDYLNRSAVAAVR